MQPPKILDNKQQGRVIDELREALQPGAKLAVISAYFTIYAYEALKKELSSIEEMRFIFTAPSYIKQKNDFQREFYIAPRDMGNHLSGNEFELKLRNKLTQSAIAKECADWLRRKVRIRSYRETDPAQLRLAYVANKDSEQDVAIHGTVDFTSDGLGLTPSVRNDSNTCMYGHGMTQGFLQLFESIWSNPSAVEDVTEKVLSEMEVLYKENAPEAIYFIALYHIFEAYLGELTEENIIKTKTGIKESLVWNKLYKFQRDGVMGAIDKIEKYGGCIIADSVGLGKTFTALAIIRYYELRNDRVLVLAPKKLRENWTIYTQNDKRNIFSTDRFNYDVLNHTDLSRYSGMSGEINLATLNWENYDLIVIDESHNFRNNVPHNERKTRYERLMEDIIKAGVRTKVLMLSATPVNNRMNDIKNQIAFITEGKNDALKNAGIPSIEYTLRKAQLVFNRWSELPEHERTTKRFVEMMELDYFKLLDTLTIARSRKHIEKYYNIEEIGRFPTRLKPINECAEIDTLGEFPPIGEVNKIIRRLTLGLYAPLRYVRPEKRRAYEKRYDMSVAGGKSVFKQVDRENQLVHLMRVNLLKRMESSIHSFVLTVEKIFRRISDTLDIIDRHEGEYRPELNIEEMDYDEEGAEVQDLVFGSKVKVLLQDMDLIKWRQDLAQDLEELTEILRRAKAITPERDQKLQTLKKRIAAKIEQPINPGNGKIIIFTAFADTAEYLYQEIAPRMEAVGIYTALVTGGSEHNKSTLPIPPTLKRSVRLSDLNTVLTLFSPGSKDGKNIFPEIQDEIDVLIATDCISEGQNLQDCDYLINYDIHWNPVRIIQRFGRIDRIGSRNAVIQLVNFWPTEDLDAYIDLAARVKGRMVLLDVSATGEENIIDEQKSKEMNDLAYRKKQLQKLQSEVVDLEDISGGISITDLTFNDFKIDLMEYMKEHEEELSHAPSGLYAIARISDNLRDAVRPGVIFVLRQIKGARQTKEQNPLFPYYLAYITEDGRVEANFVQAKQVLDYLKKFCFGQKTVAKDLADAFNAETKNGRHMEQYSALLSKTIEDLIGQKQEVGVTTLFHKGGTAMPRNVDDGMADFELVSFVVLK
ncbi:MAG: helicase-related protein [Centipeda sp. (in: firmicutes)]